MNVVKRTEPTKLKADDVDNTLPNKEVNAGFRTFGVVNEEHNETSAHGGGGGDGGVGVGGGGIVRTRVLQKSIVGNYETFTGPFGPRPICYVDWTASGRAIEQIESFISKNIQTLYGNTHTTTSITGHQSTCYRHEARQIIAQAVNAKVTGRAAEDCVLFTGNGTTSAINKLVTALGLDKSLPEGADVAFVPIVFTSSYEHHSNLLPWRESCAEVVTINYHPITGVCLQHLAQQLHVHKHRRVKIGAFSAASNVTGVVTDVDALSILMHRAGGIAVFDYATAAPYVKMDMNPVILGSNAQFVHKDAIVFSGHKFVGGPGCPGVLVLKSKLLPQQHHLPTEPGGGTVFYVTSDHHRYLSNREEREEAGTPNLLADVKLGLVVNLKQSIGAKWIEDEEFRISRRVAAALTEDPRITILGRDGATPPSSSLSAGPSAPVATGNHLPIFSFLVRSGRRFLHHNFVCALLNDLFGVQSRGGCMCAGPFSQMIMGIGREENDKIELALLEKHEVLRPGYTRLSTPFWMSDAEIDFVVAAIKFVAQHGSKFLPLYRYNHKTGEWAHTSRLTRFPERKWLSALDLLDPTSIPTLPAALGPAHSLSLSTPRAEEQPLEVEGVPRDKGTDDEAAVAAAMGSSLPLDLVLNAWGVRSLSQLLQRILAAADDLLAEMEMANDTKAKKSGGKGRGTGKGASKEAAVGPGAEAGMGGELSLFEDVRWFALASDGDPDPPFSHSSSPVDVPLGPINPALFWAAISSNGNTINPSTLVEDQAEKGSMEVEPVGEGSHDATDQDNGHLTSVHAVGSGGSGGDGGGGAAEGSHVGVVPVEQRVGSAYAVERARKLRPREGGEEKHVPRFMRADSVFASPSQSGGGTLSSNPLLAIAVQLETAVKVAAVEGGSGGGEGRHSVNGDSLDDGAKAEGLGHEGGVMETSDDSCSTGLCLPRSDGERLDPSAVLDPEKEMKKRLSGEGRTFVAQPASLQFVTPPKKIMKLVGQAVKDWNMIEDGDRLLLGLSGGKDSLALLHILLALQKRAPVRFEIACATVDPQTVSFDPSPLIPYVQSLGIQYHFLSEPIVELAKSKLQGDSLCAFCARFKRGLLYSCCRRFRYNKLVLAQHLDDLAESFFMSALHNGQVRTMKANYKIEAGDVRVIRPLAYTREVATRDFSKEHHLPIINENCPACFEQPKERDRVKKLLRQEESMVPSLFFNLKRALTPLMDDAVYAAMDATLAGVEANARGQRMPAPKGMGQGARSQRRMHKQSSGPALTKGQEQQDEKKGDDGHERVLIASDSLTGILPPSPATRSVVAADRYDDENDGAGQPTKRPRKEISEGAKGSDEVEDEGEDEDSVGASGTSRGQGQCTDGYCAPCYELA